MSRIIPILALTSFLVAISCSSDYGELANAQVLYQAKFPDVYNGCPSINASVNSAVVPKGCFGSPGNCIETRDCALMATYKLVDGGVFELEIYGQAITKDSYVAVGFSDDSKMGDDSVIQCTNYGGNVAAYNAFNQKRGNYRITSNNDLDRHFELLQASYDGNLYCRVRQSIDYSIPDIAREFHLNTQPYYILMATGLAGSSQIQIHVSKLSSSEPIDLTKYTNSALAVKARTPILALLHGSLMVIAWLIAASIGVLMPRYMKKSFDGRQMMGKDLWFIIHQGLMGTTWAFTMIAFVIIFIHKGGWSGNGAHPIIGCITTSLAFIQPIMAALRPEPNTTNRFIFNWSHSLVGYAAHLLALICIFLAVDVAHLNRNSYWFLSLHLICYVAAQVTLTKKAEKIESSSSASMNRSIVFVFALIAVVLSLGVILLNTQ